MPRDLAKAHRLVAWPLWDAPRSDSPFEQRRLRIINAIFMALERCGMKPSIDKEARELEVYTNGTFDSSEIYPRGSTMLEMVEQNSINFASHPEGDILRPKRNATPSAVVEKVKSLRMPTGYYKVIYPPATGGEPAHAIGFLLPHTFENLNHIPNVDPEEAFWAFVSRIDLIEEASGTRFSGISESMKQVWGDSFFLSRRTGRDIRSQSCGLGTPKGVVENATPDQRIAICTDRLN